MKLSDWKDAYYSYSGSASSVTRQAAFAGIALVWIFKSDTGSAIVLPEELLWPSFFLIFCLFCDLMQYILSSAIWGSAHRIKEIQGASHYKEIQAPAWFNWPGLAMYWAKHIFVFLGYYGLLWYVYSALEFGTS